jgi:hypothetical protein
VTVRSTAPAVLCRVTDELANWIDRPDWPVVARRLAAWSGDEWSGVINVADVHGLPPLLDYFRGSIPSSVLAGLTGQVSPRLRCWIAQTDIARQSWLLIDRSLTSLVREFRMWPRSPREGLSALDALLVPDRGVVAIHLPGAQSPASAWPGGPGSRPGRRPGAPESSRSMTDAVRRGS